MNREKDSLRKIFKTFLIKSKMTVIVFIQLRNIINIIIIDYYSFMIRIESLDWIPYIIRMPLQCNESIENFEYYEDYDPYCLDNYYSDQEYWFDGDE